MGMLLRRVCNYGIHQECETTDFQRVVLYVKRVNDDELPQTIHAPPAPNSRIYKFYLLRNHSHFNKLTPKPHRRASGGRVLTTTLVAVLTNGFREGVPHHCRCRQAINDSRSRRHLMRHYPTFPRSHTTRSVDAIDI